jgi:hypothetical protein
MATAGKIMRKGVWTGKTDMDGGVVLLAEDRADMADLFVQVLRMNGSANEVVAARDGAEALDYLFATGDHAGRDVSVLPRLVHDQATFCGTERCS